MTSLFLICLLTAALRAEPQNGVSIVLETALKNPSQGEGRAGRVAFHLGGLSLDEPRELELLGEAINFSQQAEPIIIIQTPRELDGEDRRIFDQYVIKQLSQRFPSARYVTRIIDTPALLQEGIDANRSIFKFMDSLGEERKAFAEIAENAIRANKDINRLVLEWREASLKLVQQIKTNERSKTLAFGAVIGGATTSIPAFIYITAGGLNPFSIAQVIFQAAVDQLNTSGTDVLFRFEQKSRIRFFENFPLVKFYNNQFMVRAGVVSFLVNAGYTTFIKSMDYMQHPLEVESPYSAGFALSMLGVAGMNGLLSSLSDTGQQSLEGEKFISVRAKTVLNSSLNLLTTINATMLGMGFSTKYVMMGLALEWGSRGLASVFANTLPTRTARWHVIHPSISEPTVENIKYLNGLEDSLKAKDLSADQIMEKIRDVKSRQKRELPEIIVEKARSFARKLSLKAAKSWSSTCELVRWLFL